MGICFITEMAMLYYKKNSRITKYLLTKLEIDSARVI